MSPSTFLWVILIGVVVVIFRALWSVWKTPKSNAGNKLILQTMEGHISNGKSGYHVNLKALAQLVRRDREHIHTVAGMVDRVTMEYLAQKPSFDEVYNFWTIRTSIGYQEELQKTTSKLFAYLISSCKTKRDIDRLNKATGDLGRLVCENHRYELLEQYQSKRDRIIEAAS